MIDPEGPLSYIIILILLFISAFCSGTESAYNYCNRYKIKVWADDGRKSAKAALHVLNKMDNTIIAILILNNIVNILCSVIATVIAVYLLGDMGSVVATIAITILVFIFGEFIPKNIAKSNSDKWAIGVSYIMVFLIYVLFPIIYVFNAIVILAKWLFKVKETSDDVFDDDDFQDTVEKISDDGAIDEEESEIIIAAVDWGDTRVSEVLTKKKDIVAINIKDCNEEYLKQFLLNNSYSRIPVYEKNINNIIGILHVRMFLKELFSDDKINIKSILLKPYVVNPRIKLDDIFEGFKEHHTHIAIVKEKGQTIGMVTMKDILEELVSDIDEADTSLNEGGAIDA